MFRPLPLVTLTTDFGAGSSYAAALKGAVLAVNPLAQVTDLTHAIPPQDVAAASQFVAETIPHFPSGTIHIVVVDPGVGTDRALLCIVWRGQAMLAPDNGCWTSLERIAAPDAVYQLTDRSFSAPTVSPTFHGRDILAPVAGRLTLGLQPAELGPPTDRWVRLNEPAIQHDGRTIRGQIMSIDNFGNAITSLDGQWSEGGPVLHIGGQTVSRWVRTYGDAELGALVALIGSNGMIEIAMVNGSAADRCGIRRGDPVEVRRA